VGSASVVLSQFLFRVFSVFRGSLLNSWGPVHGQDGCLLLLRVVGIDLRTHVLVADVEFVDLLELLDGFLALVHLLEHAAELVDQLLLFVIERGLFLDGGLEHAYGGVVHAAAGEALRQVTQRSQALVGIGLGLLKFADGFRDLARVEIVFPQFEAHDQVGLEPFGDGAVSAGDPQQNARVLRDVLSGTTGTERSLAVLNAAAAIYVGGRADSIAAGVERAQESIDSGAASGVLDAWLERAR